MKTDRFFRFLQVFTLLIISPVVLYAQFTQEDVSVEFSLKNPNEYVCEIRNMTKSRMSILLSKEEGENRGDLHFDMVRHETDTIQRVFYSLMKNENQRRFLYLDPGQAYTVSYKDNNEWKFIKAYVYIDYSISQSTPIVVATSYRKTFDLTEIKDKSPAPARIPSCGKLQSE